MRRAALLAVLALAGCGGGKSAKPHHPKATPTHRERVVEKKVKKRLEKSSLPKDMQRELDEAQKLLDASD